MKKKAVFLCMCLSWATCSMAVTVNPGTNNIQAAINNASPGDIINLAAGTFNVSTTITINKRITLKGAGKGVTILKKTNAITADIVAIVVNVDGVTLRDFTVNGDNRGGPGIIVTSNSNQLLNLGVNRCGNNDSKRSGLLLDTAHLNTLNNITASDNRMVGISQSESSDNTITNCLASNNGAEGLTIDRRSHNCKVTNCTFNGNNNRLSGVGGVGIDQSNGAILDRCTIDGTSRLSGVTFQNNLGGDDGCQIKNCTITNSAEWAIRVRNCTYQVTNTTFTNNTYRNNARGNVKWDCPPPARVSAEVTSLADHQLLTVYHSPSTGMVSFGLPADIQPTYIHIFSMDGRTVFSLPAVRSAAQLQHLNLTPLRSGVYMYVLGHTNGEFKGKFLVQ